MNSFGDPAKDIFVIIKIFTLVFIMHYYRVWSSHWASVATQTTWSLPSKSQRWEQAEKYWNNGWKSKQTNLFLRVLIKALSFTRAYKSKGNPRRCCSLGVRVQLQIIPSSLHLMTGLFFSSLSSLAPADFHSCKQQVKNQRRKAQVPKVSKGRNRQTLEQSPGPLC